MLLNFEKSFFQKEPVENEVFEAYIDLYNLNICDPMNRIYDVSELPLPKKTILNNLLKMLGDTENAEFSDALCAGILHLANYQEGVESILIDRMLPADLLSLGRAAKNTDELKAVAKKISMFHKSNKNKIDKYAPLISAETDRMCKAIYAVTGRDICAEADKFKQELQK